MVPGDSASLDKHGNPNTVTRDKATSQLAQCPTAQTVLVEVERWSGPAPAVTAFRTPLWQSTEIQKLAPALRT